MASGDLAPVGGAPAARRCVFCHRAGKLTNEHVIPCWLESGEDSGRAVFIRERGGPDYEPWRASRPGKPREGSPGGMVGEVRPDAPARLPQGQPIRHPRR
jgi:hypothetical protein